MINNNFFSSLLFHENIVYNTYTKYVSSTTDVISKDSSQQQAISKVFRKSELSKEFQLRRVGRCPCP